ncbi:FAS-associated death domain protein [Pholidichthys leucotaenia]
MSAELFHKVLLDISRELSSNQLQELKFLVRDEIKRKALEGIDNGTKLFEILMERNKLSAENTEYLSDLLTKIHRPDLSERLRTFERDHEAVRYGTEPAETEKLNKATDVIAENVGRPWRKLGRKLGLSEVKLDSISANRHTDLEEVVRELLKEWRKMKGAEARTEELIKALRDCQLNMTADKVEEKLGLSE